MDDFWEQTGDIVTIQHSYQTPQNNDDQEFDFTSDPNQYVSSVSNNQQYGHMQSNEFTSFTGGYEQDEVARAIREEEQRIQKQLQQKANLQYELKQKRKQQARQWLEDFFNKKQQQTIERKEENLAKQERLIKEIRSSETAQGWGKVAKSVDLKQSEYKGSKDINRMRESIIHKKQDESSSSNNTFGL